MASDFNGRSISTVLGDIVQNIQDIMRSEVRLAKCEIRKEVLKAKVAGILVGIGALFGFFAVLFVLLAIVFALNTVMPAWAAAVVVSVATGGAAALLLMAGRTRLRHVRPLPERTVETIKENFQWTKTHTS